MSGLGFEVCGLELGVSGLGFEGLGFRIGTQDPEMVVHKA